jgi:uncharacterized protein YodC (DUF2158 family)
MYFSSCLGVANDTIFASSIETTRRHVQASYKTGDLVELRSGGPVMTVEAFFKGSVLDSNVPTVRCQWFSGKKLEEGDFPVGSLKPAENKTK